MDLSLSLYPLLMNEVRMKSTVNVKIGSFIETIDGIQMNICLSHEKHGQIVPITFLKNEEGNITPPLVGMRIDSNVRLNKGFFLDLSKDEYESALSQIRQMFLEQIRDCFNFALMEYGQVITGYLCSINFDINKLRGKI